MFSSSETRILSSADIEMAYKALKYTYQDRSEISTFAALSKRANHAVRRRVKQSWADKAAYRKTKESLAKPVAASSFHYSPLPTPTCIRLLKIEPGRPSDMLRCSIRVVDLGDRPKYTALSYSWRKDPPWVALIVGSAWDQFNNTPSDAEFARRLGAGLSRKLKTRIHAPGINTVKNKIPGSHHVDEREKPSIIWCNGKKMRVYPNLYNALLHLRQDCPGEYWIDAVCINQTDTKERNAQVAMMGKIYQLAESVTVWLGTCSTTLSNSLGRLLATAAGSQFSSTRQPFKTSNDRSIEELDDFLTTCAAIYLFTRRWFRRLWVLQEACLAERVTFRLGHHEIDTHILVNLITWFGSDTFVKHLRKDGSHSFFKLLAMHVDYTKYVPHILASIESCKKGAKFPLSTWLQVCRGRGAEDTRDIVNAGLALIEPETLRIKQNLIVHDASASESHAESREESATFLPAQTDPKSALRPAIKLWDQLHADYDAPAPQVLLNIAAALLSQPHPTFLLSIAALYNDPMLRRLDARVTKDFGSRWNRESSSETQEVQNTFYHSWSPATEDASMPSWVPNPTWTFQALEPFCSLNPTPQLEACSSLVNESKISHDGRTLYMEAAPLDTIAAFLPDTRLSESFGRFSSLVDSFCELPTQYGHAKLSCLDVLSRVFPAGSLPNEEALLGFLERLNQRFFVEFNSVDSETEVPDTQIADPTDPEYITAYDEARRRRQERQYGLQCSYNSLRSKYAKAFELLERKRAENPGEAPKLAFRFSQSEASVLTWRRAFITRTGYIGLGPTWAKEGDTVMLVKGAYVPYIFTHIDNHLRHKAENAQLWLDIDGEKEYKEKADEKKRACVINELDHARKAMKTRTEQGGKDEWVLCGEAYVEGVMSGEMVEAFDGKWESISIV